MQGNETVLRQLAKFYEDLTKNQNFAWSSESRADIEAFARQINHAVSDIEIELAKGRNLAQIANDRKILVSTSACDEFLYLHQPSIFLVI